MDFFVQGPDSFSEQSTLFRGQNSYDPENKTQQKVNQQLFLGLLTTPWVLLKVPLTPKYFLRLNKSLHLFETHCTFLNQILTFLWAVKVTKSSRHLLHDRASKGHGSIRRRQRGRVIRTTDLKSVGHGFKSRSDR